MFLFDIHLCDVTSQRCKSNEMFGVFQVFIQMLLLLMPILALLMAILLFQLLSLLLPMPILQYGG